MTSPSSSRTWSPASAAVEAPGAAALASSTSSAAKDLEFGDCGGGGNPGGNRPAGGIRMNYRGL